MGLSRPLECKRVRYGGCTIETMSREKLADFVLRIGLAFAFLYPPVSALFDPLSWIGYFPHFVRGYVPDMVLLHSFGAVEVVLALWLLSGWKVFYPAMLMSLMLLGIILFDISDFQILFRDVSILAIGVALVVKNWPQKREVALG